MAIPARPSASTPAASAPAALSLSPARTIDARRAARAPRPCRAAQGADDGIDRHQLGQAGRVHPAEGQELVVVGRDPERPVVVELGREHRVLGRRGPAGEAGDDVVHGLEVTGRGPVDLGPLLLEVQEVTQRQTAADRRDAVDLHEALEGVGVLGQEGPAEVTPPLVVVHGHRARPGTRSAPTGTIEEYWLHTASGPDRRIRHLTDGADHRVPRRLGVLFDDVAVAPGDQRAAGRSDQASVGVDPHHLDVRAADVDADGGDAHAGGQGLLVVHHVGHHGPDELVGVRRHAPGDPAVDGTALRRLVTLCGGVGDGLGEVGGESVHDPGPRLRPGDRHVQGVGVLLAVEAPAPGPHEVVDVVHVELVGGEREQEGRVLAQHPQLGVAVHRRLHGGAGLEDLLGVAQVPARGRA